MQKKLRLLSHVCFILGFASIVGSIAVWFIVSARHGEPEYAERFGIFVGLWAPTFMILSDRLDRYADKAAQ